MLDLPLELVYLLLSAGVHSFPVPRRGLELNVFRLRNRDGLLGEGGRVLIPDDDRQVVAIRLWNNFHAPLYTGLWAACPVLSSVLLVVWMGRPNLYELGLNKDVAQRMTRQLRGGW